mgnify:CR=1 FL=1
MHTSSYYGHADLVVRLLNTLDIDGQPLDPNIKDYKGATSLHRCKHPHIVKILIDFGANINAKDLDGNTPMHLKAFGERNKPSELDIIELLLFYQADTTVQNKKVKNRISF